MPAKIGDPIALLFFMPNGNTMAKEVGRIEKFHGPETGDATHVVTDIPKFEALEIPLTDLEPNPTYTWVANFQISRKAA